MASRISHKSCRNSRSLLRWIVTRTTGTATAVRIMRIVMATISSTTVKPLSLEIRSIDLRLVHRHNGLRPTGRHRLHAGIFQHGAVDAQRRLAGRLGLEGERKYLTVAVDADASGWPRRRKLQDAHHAVVAMHQRDRLAVLREHGSVRDIH